MAASVSLQQRQQVPEYAHAITAKGLFSGRALGGVLPTTASGRAGTCGVSQRALRYGLRAAIAKPHWLRRLFGQPTGITQPKSRATRKRFLRYKYSQPESSQASAAFSITKEAAPCARASGVILNVFRGFRATAYEIVEACGKKRNN